MIRFKDVTYSNIMSVGNTPITVDLAAWNKTLITGTNGAGKSTFIEAVCYALYGKPFRDIKKTQIVNCVNKKKMLVEINFQDNKHVYKVIRGIKPNKFEIWKDDELIPQDASTAEYQARLEKNILQMSLSTFKQIAVLGTAGFTPFMLLPAAKRREIVEDLLDIGIFSDMAALNKIEQKKLNEKIKDTEADIEKRMSELRLHVEFQKEQKENRDGDLQLLEDRKATAEKDLSALNEPMSCAEEQIFADTKVLKELESTLAASLAAAKELQLIAGTLLTDKHNALVTELDTKHTTIMHDLSVLQTTEQNAMDSLHEDELLEKDRENAQKVVDHDAETSDNTPAKNDDEIGELSATIMSNKMELGKLKENRKFYEDHTDCPCPTCHQSISAKFAGEFLELANKQIDEMTAETNAAGKALKAAMADKAARKTYIEDRANDRRLLETSNSADRATLVKSHAAARRAMIDSQQLATSTARAANNSEMDELRAVNLSEITALREEHAATNEAITTADVKTRTEIAECIANDRAELATMTANSTSLTRTIATIEADLADVKMKASAEDRSELIKSLTKEVKDVKSALAVDMQTKHCRNIVGTLLKDDGVKSMIVRQYIPMINKYINEYLKTMGANYNFVLDEEFNETIKSRGRDDFSYTSFSQGERCRIDLALLFSFRDLVSARTGSMTNLLVFDEILDGPSDVDAVEAFNMILDNVDSNVFVISHSDKHDQSSYDKHINFVKKGNFTRES
ncbi:RecF/RecN/SMC N terminal domain protein [Vibrio phage 1.081.O._10N.286.52.C2]|nr:RecF/RecN/SMC N terminal domain protein [Vibrio phage 1.081.O._10N.286.52.C2]